MSRVLVLLALLALATLTVASASLALAMVFAALKALVVGAFFMELRGANRLHAAAFAGWAVLVAAGVWLLGR